MTEQAGIKLLTQKCVILYEYFSSRYSRKLILNIEYIQN